MKRYNALVIGAGPAGNAAALYLARFGLSVAMVEKSAPGGLMLLTADIENYPGFPKGVQGYELADAMTAQLEPYDIARIVGEVKAIDASVSPKRVLIDAEWVEADTIIISSGVQYRNLGVPGEEKYIGKGISYCALCDGNFFRGQPIAVVGGGNSALEESLYLSKIVSKLHLIHRRGEFRAAPIYQERIKQKENVILEYHSVISALHGENGLEAVSIKDVRTGEERTLAVNGLFVFIGFVPVGDFWPKELERDAQGFVPTDTEMCTNIPGIFAAGDIRAKGCRQIATAVGDGVTAANSAYLYLENQHG